LLTLNNSRFVIFLSFLFVHYAQKKQLELF
jgi:hypothetical protein